MKYELPPNFHKLYRKNSQQLNAIEGLRGIAAIGAMLYHIAMYGALFMAKPDYLAMLNQRFFKLALSSDIFLDTFFVLSGLLIGYLLLKEYQERGKISLHTFLIRRCARIYPLYVVFLILAIPFSSANLPNAWTNLLQINNALPLSKQYVNWCWTLAVDFQFYLLFGLILWLISKKIIGKKICYALTVLFFIIPTVLYTILIVSGKFYHFSNDVFVITSEECQRYLNIGYDKLYFHTPTILCGVLTAYALVYHQPKLTNLLDKLSKNSVNALTLGLLASIVLLMSNHPIWFLNRTQDLWQNNSYWLLMYHTLFSPLLCSVILLTNTPKGIVSQLIVRFLNLAVWRPFARLSLGTYLFNPFILLLGYSMLFALAKPVSQETYLQFGLWMILATYILVIPLYIFLELPAMTAILQTSYRQSSWFKGLQRLVTPSIEHSRKA